MGEPPRFWRSECAGAGTVIVDVRRGCIRYDTPWPMHAPSSEIDPIASHPAMGNDYFHGGSFQTSALGFLHYVLA